LPRLYVLKTYAYQRGATWETWYTWEGSGHGMLDGMELDICFQNRLRAIGHFERWIILTVTVERIMLEKTDAEHIRYFENGLLAVDFLHVGRELDHKTSVVCAGAAISACGVCAVKVLSAC